MSVLISKSATSLFQSSPARGGGCNKQLPERRACGIAVSILTRPWGRVQLSCWDCTMVLAVFQSSPARGGGCNASRRWLQQMAKLQFQSSPARGGGCNTSCACERICNRAMSFQSSPARGGGCNLRESYESVARRAVSILTRPWGRVQLRVRLEVERDAD